MIIFFRNIIDNILRIPELKKYNGADFDGIEATVFQRQIFKKKEIIRFIYNGYCRQFVLSSLSVPKDSWMIEIGSGISPLKNLIPKLVCTDLFQCPWIDISCSAYALPFKNKSVDRVFLMFVCHHLGEINKFLDEAYRCLKPGGEMVIVDPAITLFSKFYYKYCHIDKMNLRSKEWSFEGKGRLSDSNIALTWTVFIRDNDRFKKLYPEFVIKKVEYITCLAFLLSGGLRIRQLLPTFILKILVKFENWIIHNITSQIAVTMALTLKRL